jgi:hypothetical protein
MPMTDFTKKILRTATTFLSLSLFGLAVVSGNTSRLFSLTIRPVHDVATAGSQIRLQVVLTNTSDHDIGILKSAPESDYIVDVRDSRGNVAPDTDFGRKQKDPATVKVSVATPMYSLKPGESLRDEIQIERLYKISSLGRYNIQVSRIVPEEMGSGVVKSNTVNVTVTP